MTIHPASRPAFLVALLWFSTQLTADDWPQWRGPRRDAVSRETGLRQEWISSPPRLRWRAEGLGKGYCSVVVSRGRLFTMGRRGNQVICSCLDEKTGDLRWSRVIDKTTRMPCSTPTVDGDRLYALDPDGDLACLSVDRGRILWRRSYLKEFAGIMMSGRGYGESPLVDGDRLICTPGGAKSTLVALNKHTGELIWRATVPELGKAGRPGSGFSSPIISTACGVRQYVQLIGRGLVGIRADDGKFLWGYNPIANRTANIPTPIANADLVFAANGYNAGSVLLKLEAKDGGISARPIYKLRGGRFQNHHGGIALIDGHIFGGHGSNNGLPTCLNLQTGKQRWKRRGPGVGSAAIVYADKRLYFRYQNGVIALIKASTEGYDLKGKFQLPGADGDSWSHPVVANGSLLLREKDRLFAYDIRKQSAAAIAAGPGPNDELATALKKGYSGRSLFRYARGESPKTGEPRPIAGEIALRRLTRDELTADGGIQPGVARQLAALDRLVVDLAGLPVRDKALDQLAQCTGLFGLNLELCIHISDAGLKHLARARNLRVIRLTGTPVTHQGLQHLAQLKHLAAIDLEVCEQIADEACRVLGRMPQLKALVLKKTGFEPKKITAEGFSHLARATKLESLSLYGNQVDDKVLSKLAGLQDLRDLDLSLTSITDKGLPLLKKLEKLQHLQLLYSEGFAGPKITDAGLAALAEQKSLRSLNLVGAKITDAGLPRLNKLKRLRSLRLVNTGISTHAVEKLRADLPQCMVVR